MHDEAHSRGAEITGNKKVNLMQQNSNGQLETKNLVYDEYSLKHVSENFWHLLLCFSDVMLEDNDL